MAIELRKAILTSFSILFLSFMLFVIPFNTLVSGSTSTIKVPQDYPTIQEAINHANSGDTIFVSKNRTYRENVVVNKRVSLVGEDKNSTIIDGGRTGSVISVMASNVSIRGFTVRNSGNNTPFDSGIFIVYSSDNGISGNNIVNNNVGIYLYFSSYSVVSSNTVNSSTSYGIYLSYSINNTIYHNNFYNTYQVWSDLKNVWDYNGEGNYWSDYTGQDLNGDGIGDPSYAIDVANKDNYPLMGMFSDFNVTLKRETYHVTVISNSTISSFRFEVGAETGDKIIRFKATGNESTVGFSRVTIPIELMSYPFMVLVGQEEVIPNFQNVSKDTHANLYFTYIHSSDTITIISSKMLKLQIDLNTLNATYNDLLNNYSVLLGNYSRLQESYRGLNISYIEHLQDYSENVLNIRNLTYILAATTAIFIITTIYLSKNTRPPSVSKMTRITESTL